MTKDFLKNYSKIMAVLFIFTQRLSYMPFIHEADLAVGGLMRLYSMRSARKKQYFLCITSGTGLL